MKTKELIDALRVCADDDIICPACERYETMGKYGGTAKCHEDLMLKAAERLDQMEAELRDERHRHDRLQDFEVAEAEELRKLREQNRWIPVTERLPTEDEWLEAEFSSFLCRMHVPASGGVAVEDVRVVPYTGYNGWICEGVIITHWMPLPEPPKEIPV